MLLLSLQPVPGLKPRPLLPRWAAAVPPGASPPWPGPCCTPRSGFVGVIVSAASLA